MHIFVKLVHVNLTGASDAHPVLPVRILLKGFLIEGRGGDIQGSQEFRILIIVVPCIIVIRNIKPGQIIPIGIKGLQQGFSAGLGFCCKLQQSIDLEYGLLPFLEFPTQKNTQQVIR